MTARSPLRRHLARSLDQFFTKDAVARACVERLLARITGDLGEDRIFLEPSAGAGAFLRHLPEPRLGIDVDPQTDGIEKADFLAWQPREAGLYVVVGNPPFGTNASLAVRFFNHAATFAYVVAFVVPRTFRKTSLVRRLNPAFHLLEEIELEPYAFLFEGEDFDVPALFQIWRRGTTERVIEPAIHEHPDIAFVAKEEGEFAFQRVGRRAGKVSDTFSHLAQTSHYFIKDMSAAGDLRAVLSTIDWSSVKTRTAGVPSISKAELVEAYRRARE